MRYMQTLKTDHTVAGELQGVYIPDTHYHNVNFENRVCQSDSDTETLVGDSDNLLERAENLIKDSKNLIKDSKMLIEDSEKIMSKDGPDSWMSTMAITNSETPIITRQSQV